MVDQQIPSSFIPKKQESSRAFASHRGGFFSFLATLIFVVALITFVGVFVYQKYLEGQISKMETSLAEARVALQEGLIKELSRTDKRLRAADELVANHVTVSAFFELLQSLTLQSVRFNSFGFSTTPNGQLAVTLEGEAVSYTTLAYQAEVIRQNEVTAQNSSGAFISPQFSDLDLNDRGDVTFTFQTRINRNVVSYIENLRRSGGLNTGEMPQAPVEGEMQTLPAVSGEGPQATQPN